MRSRTKKKAGVSKGEMRVKTVSMTGFGRAAETYRGVRIEVEAKTVNNRFTDLSLRMPREYSVIEPDVRELISAKIQRGRVEITVSRRVEKILGRAGNFNVSVFDELAKRYYSLAKREGVLDREFKRQAILEMLSRRELIDPTQSLQEIMPGESKAVLRVVETALAHLRRSREREGSALGRDVARLLRELTLSRDRIANLADEVPRRIKTRLADRIRELAAGFEIDAQRLAAEVAILADRADISEELVRLAAHIKEARASLQQIGTGRRLDFLLQEFARELNTIASKAGDANIAKLVVDAKSIVEKVREQVQNLE